MIKISYVNHMGSDLDVVNNARLSFNRSKDALDDKDIKLIKYLADNKHMSPFEHCVLSAELYVPVYISKQIMRHRTFSYNEVSRRYTSEDLQFYMPKVWRKQSQSNRQASEGALDPDKQHIMNVLVNAHHWQSLRLYEDLILNGVSRELARGVLPQNLMTKFVMTGNLRNWAHFVKLREHEGAQEEVRTVSTEIKSLLLLHYPVAAKAIFDC